MPVNAHTLPLRIASRLSLAFPRAPKRAHSRSLSPRSAFESRHGPPHCMPVLSARSQSRATCAAIAALIRISTAKLLVQSAMHAAATLGRLASTTTRGLHHNGDCCTSSRDAGQVRIRGRLGGAQRSGGVRGRDWRAAGRRGEGEQRFPVGEYGERIVVAAYDDGEGTGDEIKLECDASGCVIVKTTSKTLEEEDDRGGFLCCDLTGCFFADEPPAEKTFEVLEGEGWRLGYETAPDSEESFCAIVGAGGWSLALTASEFNDFCYLIQTLRKGISTMDEDGVIGNDEVVMQVERGSLWMECSIPKKRVAIFQDFWKLGNRALVDSQQKTAFKLRFLLANVSGRRQAEGFWPPEAVMDMLKKIDAVNLEQEALANAQKPAAANA